MFDVLVACNGRFLTVQVKKYKYDEKWRGAGTICNKHTQFTSLHHFAARDSQKDDIKELSHSDMTRSVERSLHMGILPKEATVAAVPMRLHDM